MSTSLRARWVSANGVSVPGRVVPAVELDDVDLPVDPADEAAAIDLFAGSAELVDDSSVLVGVEPEDEEPDWDPVLELETIGAGSEIEAAWGLGGLEDLDADLTLAAAADNQGWINAARARQLAIAAHWADLHNAESVRPVAGRPASAGRRYDEGLVAPGRSGLNASAHDPAPLGDLAVPYETELLEQGLRPGVQVGTALRLATLDLFRVRLDQASAGALDRGQGRR